MTAEKPTLPKTLEALRDVLDRRGRFYRELADAPDLGAYLERKPPQDDEEILTEPILADILKQVGGPRAKLMLLGELVALADRATPADLRATEVPRDMDAYRTAVDDAAGEVERLLAAGRILVEAAERLVCALYAIPPELEDEVVAHAVARAAGRYAV